MDDAAGVRQVMTLCRASCELLGPHGLNVFVMKRDTQSKHTTTA
jgi:hypothetical protein